MGSVEQLKKTCNNGETEMEAVRPRVIQWKMKIH